MLSVLAPVIVVVVSGQSELLHPLSAHCLTANSALDTGDSISQPVPVLVSPVSPGRLQSPPPPPAGGGALNKLGTTTTPVTGAAGAAGGGVCLQYNLGHTAAAQLH